MPDDAKTPTLEDKVNTMEETLEEAFDAVHWACSYTTTQQMWTHLNSLRDIIGNAYREVQDVQRCLKGKEKQ